MNDKYQSIFKHYEKCFDKYGDNHRGVDWPNSNDAHLRYKVMLDLIKTEKEPISLLDFGCGASHLYEYINCNNIKNIIYTGLDISKNYIDFSKNKYPNNNYIHCDILKQKRKLGNYDYIIINGVFTEKIDLQFDEMFSFMKSCLLCLWKHVNTGIAFNVMSSFVDWKRDDLFHLSLDLLANFLCDHLSRNFIIRNDYRLYEYTSYVYK